MDNKPPPACIFEVNVMGSKEFSWSGLMPPLHICRSYNYVC